MQLDEPSYTGYVDPATLARMHARGEDPMKNLRRAIQADNAVIEGLKGRATFGLHVCRGNRASIWHREGKYDAIAETPFGGLNFDRPLLEYDTERTDGFASGIGGNLLSEDEQWRKLEVMLQTAQRVWG